MGERISLHAFRASSYVFRNGRCHKYKLETMSYDLLIQIFGKRYNTPEKYLRLIDECNSLSFKKIATQMPSTSFEERTVNFLHTLGGLMLYLRDSISDLQRKCKLIEAISPYLAFDIALVHGICYWMISKVDYSGLRLALLAVLNHHTQWLQITTYCHQITA